jgi:MFS family permease
MRRPEITRRLDAAHARLERDGVLELELRSPSGLLERDGRPESGVETLAGVLVSAPRLPESVTVRVVLTGSLADADRAEAEYREHCLLLAESAWRRAETIRRSGRRQIAPSLATAAVAATVASAAGAAAESVGSNLLKAVLYVVLGIGVISAWVIAWMPIEELLFDWRPDGRRTRAYDLLARCELELVDRVPLESAVTGAPLHPLGMT